MVLTPLGPGVAFGGVAPQPDGKIVAGGGAFVEGGDVDSAVARYWGDTIDRIFADGFQGP